ncbi:MAG: hypothetical protein COB53_07895 [Elusimicrobia bacterium]|nr:MAG: hypothetical protein COB53_07895 [Elusimicrobiota bacterium]
MTRVLALAAVFALAVPARPVEVIPIYGVSFLGGQYFFASDKSKLNANIKANVAPALKFEDSNWTLIPMYNGNFRGTKSVSDPVGSSTLFQQGMDHRISARGIYQRQDSNWKLKPTVAFKREFLRETRDETWGQGLFDFWTTSLGVEAENEYQAPFSYRFGYDIFFTKFPNFQSLESQSGVDPSGQPLGRERAGVDVLDTLNQQVSASITRPFPFDNPKVSVSAAYRLLYADYRDQPIIDVSGQPSTLGRQDFRQTLGLSIGMPKSYRGGRLRAGYGFNFNIAHNGSNQNTFDAGQSRFMSDTYSYLNFSVGPNANFSWGPKNETTSVSVGFTYSRTSYSGRLAQNTAGAFLADGQTDNRFLLALGYAYPIAPNFKLTARTNVLRQTSNQKFEQSYRYTFTTANYLLGFAYDY